MAKFFFFSSRRRHTRCYRDWSSDVCSSDLLRNALIPVVTVIGLQMGRLLAGSIIVETVFARQGVGQLAIEAILQKDYPLVQGIILMTATAYVLANLLVDISYGFINPKIRTA